MNTGPVMTGIFSLFPPPPGELAINQPKVVKRRDKNLWGKDQ
jgi:hypothetical protein